MKIIQYKNIRTKIFLKNQNLGFFDQDMNPLNGEYIVLNPDVIVEKIVYLNFLDGFQNSKVGPAFCNGKYFLYYINGTVFRKEEWFKTLNKEEQVNAICNYSNFETPEEFFIRIQGVIQ